MASESESLLRPVVFRDNDWISLLFSFSGLLNRKTFFFISTPLVVACIVFGYYAQRWVNAAFVPPITQGTTLLLLSISFWVSWIYSAAAVKRLRDMGLNPLWIGLVMIGTPTPLGGLLWLTLCLFNKEYVSLYVKAAKIFVLLFVLCCSAFLLRHLLSETSAQKEFMLSCLINHSNEFCTRYWDMYPSKSGKIH